MNSTGLAYVNLLPTGSEELEICHDMEIFEHTHSCLLYTSDAADDWLVV